MKIFWLLHLGTSYRVWTLSLLVAFFLSNLSLGSLNNTTPNSFSLLVVLQKVTYLYNCIFSKAEDPRNILFFCN